MSKDQEYATQRYRRADLVAAKRAGNMSKLRSLLRSPHSRYADWGNEALIGLLEGKVAEKGIGNDTQKLINFLEAEIDINRETLVSPVRIAYGEAEAEHKNYDFTSTALVRRVLEKTRSLEFDTTNPRDLADVMDWLIKNEGVPLSAEGRRVEGVRAQAEKAKASIAHINAVKANILQGRDKWPQWDPKQGQVMWRAASLLDSMSPEELNRTDDEVATLRRQSKMTSEELREELRNEAKAAGIPIPFRRGDKTTLDGGSVRYKEGSSNAFEFVSEEGPRSKPSADPRMDRSVPTSSADRSVFISPDTNEYFTKKEICHIANHNPELFRRLSKTDARFLNELLAQAN